MAVQPRQQSWVQLLGAFEPLRSRTAEQLVDAFCDCTKIVNLLQESLYIAFDILDVFNVLRAYRSDLSRQVGTAITLAATPSPSMTEWRGGFEDLA